MGVVSSGYGSASWIVLLPIALIVARMFMRRGGLGQRRPGGQGGPRGMYGSPWGRAGGMSSPPPGSTFDASHRPGEPADPETEGASGSSSVRIPAGWMPDPSGKFDQRYWSGSEWTEHVTKNGTPATDPPPSTSTDR